MSPSAKYAHWGMVSFSVVLCFNENGWNFWLLEEMKMFRLLNKYLERQVLVCVVCGLNK